MVRATLFGKPLTPGGTIGVCAPATGVYERSEVERGVEWWESLGYSVKLSDSIFSQDDWVAGTPEERARDLEAMFADPEVDVVLCFRGGYGSAQLIPHLDFDLIASNPKAFVGYSDITSLHEAIRQRTGLATFYGPTLKRLGVPADDFTRERLLSVLTGGGRGAVPGDPDDPYVRSLRGGRVTAPLVGGCLWLLQQSLRTPWEFDADGAILLLEDVSTYAYHVDGQLFQLVSSGKLDGITGAVIAEFADSDWTDRQPAFPRTKSLEEIFETRLGSLGVPVVYGQPLGHGKHLATVPLGVTCTLDADAKTLTVDEPPLG